MYFLYYITGVSITNLWLHYKLYQEQLQIQRKNVLSLLHFQMQIARDLGYYAKTPTHFCKIRELFDTFLDVSPHPSQMDEKGQIKRQQKEFIMIRSTIFLSLSKNNLDIVLEKEIDSCQMH